MDFTSSRRLSLAILAAMLCAAAPNTAAARQKDEAKAAARVPRMFAIVVGIADYPREVEKPVPPSYGAARDAFYFANWLKDEAGWPAENVLVMLDSGAKSPGADPAKPGVVSPTRNNLQEFALKKWLIPRLGPEPTSDDLVVIFFAGQAVQFDKGYLLAMDGTWAVDEAVDELASRGVSVLCLLDTSLQGRGPKPVPGGREGGNGRIYLQRLARRPGVSAWLAATSGPAEVARNATEHSPFLTAVLKGAGLPVARNNLVATLGHVRSDEHLKRSGFAVSGNLHPRFTLWPNDLRGVDRAPDLLIQRGHSNHVDHLAYSPAGDMLFSAGADSTVRVWRLSDRRLWRVLTPHYQGVTALAVSPDGGLVVAGDGEGNVSIWDHEHRRRLLATGVPEGTYCGAVAFLPDGDRFITRDGKEGRGGKAPAWLWSPDKRGTYSRQEVSKTALAIAAAPVAGPIGFVVAEAADGKPAQLKAFRADGTRLKVVDGPAGKISGATLATDGRRIVAGDSEGHLVFHDAGSGETTSLPDMAKPLNALSLASDRLAVVDRKHLVLYDVGISPPKQLCVLDLPVGTRDPSVLVSPDGRVVAARLDAEQGILAWELADPANPKPIALDSAGPWVASVAFSPDGKTLTAGCQDGSIRSWSVETGGPGPTLPKGRGRVAALSSDAAGRFLLELTYDHYAFVWDLENGGAPRPLREMVPEVPVEGQWYSGVLSADGKTAFLSHKDRGDVVAFNLQTGRTQAGAPEMPKTLGPRARIGTLAAAGDPKSGRLAGELRDGSGFCVWDADGTVKRFAVDAFIDVKLNGHELGITTLEISDDGKALLVMGRSGVVAVFDLETSAAGNPLQPKLLGSLSLKDISNRSEGLFAKFVNGPIPGAPRRIALAHAVPRSDEGVRSRVLLWNVGDAKPTQFSTPVEGKVHAMAVSADGKWLTVGADLSMEVWDLSKPRPVNFRLAPRPNHLERVTALVIPNHAADDEPTIISGGDDTQIRFWPLGGNNARKLLGSIAVDQNTGGWVAHTVKLNSGKANAPASKQYVRFDSSIGGEIGVSWIDGDDVRTLEQFGQESRQLALTNDLRRGVVPDPPEDVELRDGEPPRLAIEAPGNRLSQVAATSLTIALGSEALQDLRLYQNGVPLEVDSKIWQGRREVTIPVTLVSGENRFYAMASLANAIDGRSNDVDLIFRGEEDEARLHVLAIGVSDYHDKSMILQYAVKDATDFANHLLRDQRAPEEGKSYLRIIKDDDVSDRTVQKAFDDLIKSVRGRPQDRVVLFLAGHTDVSGRVFSLLLPTFQPGKDRADTRLPLAVLYRNLTRLSALNRAVIVDACRTEEIARDPLIRRVRSLFDEHAHRARTTYILAARQGGQAGEVPALEHGVLTYVLLRGLAAPGLKTPPQAEFLNLITAGADEDSNGIVTSDELGQFADRNVPQLVSSFPELVLRAGRRASGAPKSDPLANESEGDPAPDSFPLFRLPKPGVAVVVPRP